MPDFLLIFGIIALVLTIIGLVSGLVERSPLSFPLIFLGLGFLLGKGGLSALDMGPHDLMLEIIATLTLALVLFLDAVKLQVEELGRRWLVPALVLGPGTGIIIALGAVPLASLLDFGWVVAFIWRCGAGVNGPGGTQGGGEGRQDTSLNSAGITD